MKKMKFLIMVFMAIMSVCSFVACSSDDDNEETSGMTLKLATTAVNSYQPYGTIVVPVVVSDANATLSASDFAVVALSGNFSGSVASGTKDPKISVSGLEKGSAAGEWNLIVDVNLNNYKLATYNVFVYYKDNQFGQFALTAERAHKLSVQQITADDLSIYTHTVSIEDILKEENITSLKNGCEFYLVNATGEFEDAIDATTLPCLGWVGTEGNTKINFACFEEFSTKTLYSLIVRVQRSENASDGYAWIEIPFVITAA